MIVYTAKASMATSFLYHGIDVVGGVRSRLLLYGSLDPVIVVKDAGSKLICGDLFVCRLLRRVKLRLLSLLSTKRV